MSEATNPRPAPAAGPLRAHPTNPRYFTDGSGRAVYLTGSHNWFNLQDRGQPRFDYPAYLDFLEAHHHNFIRLWAFEGACSLVAPAPLTVFEPMPYRRTGPGTAADGLPQFNLEQWDPAYFDRLRARVLAARDRGIYVGVMLFQGWSIEQKKSHRTNPWLAHPFNRTNNVNGIDGDANGNGEGEEAHTLAVPAVTRIQEAYVRKVIDTVNDLDNVLYEVTNESPIETKEWQYHIIRTIQQYEAGKPKQHPAGMSAIYSGRAGAVNALYASPADWISPQNESSIFRYDSNPPVADGRKVVLSDTDHFYGVGGDQQWVWKSFTRGHNPIYMDPLDHPYDVAVPEPRKDGLPGPDPRYEPARLAMGHTRRYAERMDLTATEPRGDIASTHYCLVNPGKEYLVYLPEGGEVTVDLMAAEGTLAVEWMHPIEGTITPGEPVAGCRRRSFKAPFPGDAVLYLASR